MSDLFQRRTARLERQLEDRDVDLALLAHPDSVCYPTAHWGDLGVEFGRPTVAAISRSGDAALITAEQVHLEALEVYRTPGFGNAYRTGRAIGYSSLGNPELKAGDKTVLAPGMVFAVDGGITLPGEFGARVGDTIIVTGQGCECATEYPKGLTVV